MKKVLSVQDISCVGKCSLTVALPVLSAAGIETCILPTALLSTHTAFSHFTFQDLTGEIPEIEEAWAQEHIRFDALYNGYLGSTDQVRLILEIRDRFLCTGGTFVCDPAMADNGKLYPGISGDFPGAMADLCGNSNFCLPNLTEAALMLDREYIPEKYDRQYICQLLRELAGLGAKVPVITGVSFDPAFLGAMAFDREKNEFVEYYTKREPRSFHGTGDLFSSAFTAAVIRNRPLQDSLRIAAETTHDAIVKTLADPAPAWYGVNFEEAIPAFISRLNG